MSRHLLQQLDGETGGRVRVLILVLVLGATSVGGLGACVDEPAPKPHSSKAVLPNLSDPARRPPPRRRADRRRARGLPAGVWQGTVDAHWVEQRLGSKKLTILDLRASAQFARGHLPGAQNDPEGRRQVRAVQSLWNPVPGARPVSFPSDVAGHTVVLVHGGQDLREQAVAARAYFALYAAGADPKRLAILRGGYAAWRHEHRPRATLPAPRPAPRPVPRARVSKPATPAVKRKSRPLLIADAEVLSTIRNKPHIQLVHVGLKRPTPRPSRHPQLAWQRVGLGSLQPAPGAADLTTAELTRRLTGLLTGRDNESLISFSERGLWASLLWFILKTRLKRPDDFNKVYLGPPPVR